MNLPNTGKETDLRNEVDSINKIPDLYSKGLKIFMTGLAAACFSRLAGCGWDAFPFVFIAGIIGQAVHFFLTGKKDFISFVILITALSATIVAAAGAKLGYGASTIVPMLVSSVCYIVPGVVLTFGFFDTLSIKFFTTGVQRLVFATLIILIIFICLFVSKTIMGV